MRNKSTQGIEGSITKDMARNIEREKGEATGQAMRPSMGLQKKDRLSEMKRDLLQVGIIWVFYAREVMRGMGKQKV